MIFSAGRHQKLGRRDSQYVNHDVVFLNWTENPPKKGRKNKKESDNGDQPMLRTLTTMMGYMPKPITEKLK